MKVKNNYLSKAWLASYSLDPELGALPVDLDGIPERVLQFGTGVLLRGLPDYFIDRSNKQGTHRGRVVVIKSTDGPIDEFQRQNNLYTICERGIADGKKVDKLFVNSSISRVLMAKEDWPKIMALATSTDMEIVISNTTEIGIVLDNRDKLRNEVPFSYPGKLLAFLHRRFTYFDGDMTKGMVILPTELIGDNGEELKKIVVQLAEYQRLDKRFLHWLREANDFCNTLVDRIVPGKLGRTDYRILSERLTYEDDLMIMVEPFRLWAIECSNDRVTNKLFFYGIDEGIVITEDIVKFKELKLRLLNASHSLCCGLASLLGFETVKSAMENVDMQAFVRRLMLEEIVPAICDTHITKQEAERFALQVLDRFSNPFIEHRWYQIAFNYTSKMNARVLPMIGKYVATFHKAPKLMAIGTAAFIRYMKCSKDLTGKYMGYSSKGFYPIQDDLANVWCSYWGQAQNEEQLIRSVLSDVTLFKYRLPSSFAKAMAAILVKLNKGNVEHIIETIDDSSELAK